MTYYFISDLHVDFYVSPVFRTIAILRKNFEVFFERNFLPADAYCIAGDIANDYFNYVGEYPDTDRARELEKLYKKAKEKY